MRRSRILYAALAALILLALAAGARSAWAHCDSLHGPVVAAGREALATGKLEVALVWIDAPRAGELRAAFRRARAVRRLDEAARDLADTWFLETLVRLHRASEGMPYTGITADEPPHALQV